MKITLTKQGNTLYPYSEKDEAILNKLSNAIYEVDIKNMDMRTIKQNSAIHKWCELIANELNSHGLYKTGIFANDLEWTMEYVKYDIIHPAIKAKFNINSTTKLKRKEIEELYDFVNFVFSTKKGIKIPDFPNKDYFDKEQQ